MCIRDSGPDAGLELQDVEGLGNIVVGAALEADDLVRVLAAGGKHDDRHVGELPDAHTGLEPCLLYTSPRPEEPEGGYCVYYSALSDRFAPLPLDCEPFEGSGGDPIVSSLSVS